MQSFRTTYFLAIFLTVKVFGQSVSNQQYTTISEKSVTDYYSGMDDKSSVQKYKIKNLKGELNNYSGRLFDLQKRFDQIFYGLSTSGNHRKPFDMSERQKENLSKRKYWYDSNFTRFQDRSDLANETTLASFPVKESQVFQDRIEVESTIPIPPVENKLETVPVIEESNGFGKYFILHPGVAFPFKVHNESPDVGEARREYVPGVSLNLATGIEGETFNFGLGAQFKRNSLDTASYYNDPNLGSESISGKSHTFAIYLDMGFKAEINQHLKAYFGTGLGYYNTRYHGHIKDYDDGLYGTGTIGLEWLLSESIKFRFGYRYAHEEEVPSHICEAGLNFAY
jgi:opacity protein-like surface antigen